jgi:hypothetical protein
VEKLLGKNLMCEECCKYFQECPYWKYYNKGEPHIEIKHPIINYKGACIKWFDDEGFEGLTDK